jgi:hypothetical protein
MAFWDVLENSGPKPHLLQDFFCLTGDTNHARDGIQQEQVLVPHRHFKWLPPQKFFGGMFPNTLQHPPSHKHHSSIMRAFSKHGRIISSPEGLFITANSAAFYSLSC